MASNFGLAQVKCEGTAIQHDVQYTALVQKMLAQGYSWGDIEAYLTQIGVYPEPKQPPKPFDPNEVPALAAKLSDLVALWEAKFGDKWVKRTELEKDEFWQRALYRFESNSLLETAVGEDDGSEWVRIKEKA